MNNDPGQSRHSQLREKVLEHIFLSELLRVLWLCGRRDIEVLRAEVDGAGYDLVLQCNGVLRYIQLKASYAGAKTKEVKIHTALASRPGGCVVWFWFDPLTLTFTQYLWLGTTPGTPIALGDRVAKHTKGDGQGRKAERPQIREVAKAAFSPLTSMSALCEHLFGLEGLSDTPIGML